MLSESLEGNLRYLGWRGFWTRTTTRSNISRTFLHSMIPKWTLKFSKHLFVTCSVLPRVFAIWHQQGGRFGLRLKMLIVFRQRLAHWEKLLREGGMRLKFLDRVIFFSKPCLMYAIRDGRLWTVYTSQRRPCIPSHRIRSSNLWVAIVRKDARQEDVRAKQRDLVAQTYVAVSKTVKTAILQWIW